MAAMLARFFQSPEETAALHEVVKQQTTRGDLSMLATGATANAQQLQRSLVDATPGRRWLAEASLSRRDMWAAPGRDGLAGTSGCTVPSQRWLSGAAPSRRDVAAAPSRDRLAGIQAAIVCQRPRQTADGWSGPRPAVELCGSRQAMMVWQGRHAVEVRR